jgi:hypothetical protein
MALKALSDLHPKTQQGGLFAHQSPRHCRSIPFSAKGLSIAVNRTLGVGKTITFVRCLDFQGQAPSRAAPERNGARGRRAAMDHAIV